jgi:hypothetical protein
VEPDQARTLVFDLGGSCAPEAWHCQATQGRSTLIALDAMGYAAAHVQGSLTPESRARLTENYLNMALVDDEHPWFDGAVWAWTDRPQSDIGSGSLHIDLNGCQVTRLDGRRLQLASVHKGQVGVAQVSSSSGHLILMGHAILDLPPDTPPDPTIAAAIAFIQSEARQYQHRRG